MKKPGSHFGNKMDQLQGQGDKNGNASRMNTSHANNKSRMKAAKRIVQDDDDDDETAPVVGNANKKSKLEEVREKREEREREKSAQQAQNKVKSKESKNSKAGSARGGSVPAQDRTIQMDEEQPKSVDRKKADVGNGKKVSPQNANNASRSRSPAPKSSSGDGKSVMRFARKSYCEGKKREELLAICKKEGIPGIKNNTKKADIVDALVESAKQGKLDAGLNTPDAKAAGKKKGNMDRSQQRL